MSWEGFYRYLCKNGHLIIRDGYEELYEEDIEYCTICDAPLAWKQQIDMTNGCDYDAFDENGEHLDSCSCGNFKLEPKEPIVHCVCSDCGNIHKQRETTYNIPTNGKGHILL